VNCTLKSKMNRFCDGDSYIMIVNDGWRVKQPDQSVGKILNEFFKAVFATNSGLWVGNHGMHLPWRTPLDTDS